MKRVFGSLLLIAGFIMLLSDFDFNITGNFIKNLFSNEIGFLQILGFVFLIGSVFLFIENKGLEYLAMPTGWNELNKERINAAKKELDKHHVDKIIITGHVDPEEFKGRWSHRQKIYKAMREYGIPKDKIKIVDGIDSEEDILYFGKFLKSGDTLYLDTFPIHYQEYKSIINKGIRDGVFPKGVKVKNVKSGGILQHPLYLVGWAEELLKRRKLDYKKNREEEGLEKIKKGVKKIIGRKS